MFVDTSAVVAILAREPEADELASKIERAATALTAGHVLVEASMRLSTMLGVGPLDAEAAIHAMFSEAGIKPAGWGMPVDWRGEESKWRDGLAALERAHALERRGALGAAQQKGIGPQV